MEHVNIKIFAVEDSANVRFADAIPVFHRWIQSRDLPELLIDVADYSHVPGGPGVLLIGHEANYALDNAQNRPGLLYARKVSGGGLRESYDAALAAAKRLEAEPEFQGKLKFNPATILRSRLQRPAALSEQRGRLEERRACEVTTFLDGLYGAGAYQVTRPSDARERLSLRVLRPASTS